MTARTAFTPVRRPATVPQISDGDLCINTLRTLAIDAVQKELILSAMRKGFGGHSEPDEAARP
jgi:hypothetical protein